MQQRVQQGLEDGARLPSLDIEKLRGENNALREEQQRLKKVICLFLCMLSYPVSLKKKWIALNYDNINLCFLNYSVEIVHTMQYNCIYMLTSVTPNDSSF